MVLILDTARFKYAPHWVPVAELYEAMASVDPATGKPRGFIKLTANPDAKSVMFTLERHDRYLVLSCHAINLASYFEWQQPATGLYSSCRITADG